MSKKNFRPVEYYEFPGSTFEKQFFSWKIGHKYHHNLVTRYIKNQNKNIHKNKYRNTNTKNLFSISQKLYFTNNLDKKGNLEEAIFQEKLFSKKYPQKYRFYYKGYTV